MSDQRLSVSRVITAPPAAIYAVLTDPRGHVAIDASGMLMSADGDVVTAAGDRFTVHMDREALGDLPMGEYDVEVVITTLVPERTVEWTIEGTVKPYIRHRYGYEIAPDENGSVVTSYYDWSDAREDLKAAGIFPVIHPESLKATLGILARTVRQGLPAARPHP
jgi:hypothetical protein